MGRRQTGCGRNRSTASLGGVMSDVSGSRRRTGGRCSYFGDRTRSAGVEDSARPVFQPSSTIARASRLHLVFQPRESDLICTNRCPEDWKRLRCCRARTARAGTSSD